MTQSVRDTKKRVKVYSYTENALWDDMGTGHVTIDFMERNNAFTVIVRSEDDGEFVLWDFSRSTFVISGVYFSP